MTEFTNSERQAAGMLAALLWDAFDWSKADSRYWTKVYENLTRIRDSAAVVSSSGADCPDFQRTLKEALETFKWKSHSWSI